MLPAATDVIGAAAQACDMIKLTSDLTAYVLVQPGRLLNQSAQERVYQGLIPVTSSSFGADMTLYWSQRSKEGYLERLAEFVLISDSSGLLVGWTGFHVLPYDEHTLIYLDSTGLVPARQSSGTMRELMRRRIVQTLLADEQANCPVYLTARSESPIFYRLMRKLLESGELYPRPGVVAPDDMVRAARNLARWLGQSDLLDAPNLTIRGAYQALDQLYGELPTTGDLGLDEMFRSKLGPLDAFLLVGRAR